MNPRLGHFWPQAHNFNKLGEGSPDYTSYQISKIVVSMIRKYHNKKPQTTPGHLEEESLNHHETPGRQTMQIN